MTLLCQMSAILSVFDLLGHSVRPSLDQTVHTDLETDQIWLIRKIIQTCQWNGPVREWH